MSSRGGCGAAPSAVVSSADEPPGRSDLGRRRTPQLQVQATEVPAEAGRGRQSGSPQVKPTILTLPRPWVGTGYRFVGPAGEVGLVDLFEGRRQLIVYRFFYAPDVEGWPEGACSGCSMFADSITH